MDQEIVIAANTDTANPSSVYVIVDTTLNNPGNQMRILYSNQQTPQSPGAVEQLLAGTVVVRETDGTTGTGPLNLRACHIGSAGSANSRPLIRCGKPGADPLTADNIATA